MTTPTVRTDDQTLTGIYWAYDGTPSLCAPPRLYNQIVMHLADQMGIDRSDGTRPHPRPRERGDGRRRRRGWESKYY